MFNAGGRVCDESSPSLPLSGRELFGHAGIHQPWDGGGRALRNACPGSTRVSHSQRTFSRTSTHLLADFTGRWKLRMEIRILLQSTWSRLAYTRGWTRMPYYAGVTMVCGLFPAQLKLNLCAHCKNCSAKQSCSEVLNFSIGKRPLLRIDSVITMPSAIVYLCENTVISHSLVGRVFDI